MHKSQINTLEKNNKRACTAMVCFLCVRIKLGFPICQAHISPEIQPSTLLLKFRIRYHKAWASWMGFKVTARPVQMVADMMRSISMSGEFCGHALLTLGQTALTGSWSTGGGSPVR